MSVQLEARLRNGPYILDHATGDIVELRQAADTLKRYRAFIETLAGRDDSIGDDARQALSDS